MSSALWSNGNMAFRWKLVPVWEDFQASCGPRSPPPADYPNGTIKRDSTNTHTTPINGVVVDRCSPKLSCSPKLEHARAVRLLNDLRGTLEGTQDQGQIFRQLSPDTQNFLKEWLERCGLHSLSNGYSPASATSTDNSDTGRVRKLETERDDLMLQVSVLSDQIDAQVEKIQDLERAVRTAHNGNSIFSMNGSGTPTVNGNLYGLELLNRSHGNGNGGPDTHKLDLMAENSNLKLRLAAIDREKAEVQLKLNYAQKSQDDLQGRMSDQSMELSELRSKYSKNGTVPSSQDSTDSEVERLKKAVESLMITNSEKDIHIDELRRQMKRFRRLEELVATTQGGALLFDNEDHSTDSSSTHTSHVSAGPNDITGKENVGDRYDFTDLLQHRLEAGMRPELRGQAHLQPNATSTPVNQFDFGSPKGREKLTNGNQIETPPSAIGKTAVSQSPKRQANTVIGRSSSCEDMKGKHSTQANVPRGNPGYGGTLPKDARLLPQQSLPAPYQALDTYHSNNQDKYIVNQVTDGIYHPRPRASTLPKGKPPKAPGSGTLTPKSSFRSSSARGSFRSHTSSETSANSTQYSTRGGQRSSDPSNPSSAHSQQGSTLTKQSSSNQQNPRKQRRFMSFGKGIFKGKSGKWSSSAPNLAQTETDEELLKDEMAQQYKELQRHGTEQRQRKHKSKSGIKRFFGKLRRSNSQDLDPDKVGDFKRSGLRATAGPRLGWSRDMKYADLDVPFARWDSDRIATWMHSIGLSMYVGDCKRWIKNGDHLTNATSQELEKELGIRNYFHRKKLQLALQVVDSDKKSPMDELDHNWVTRWMDDIGLPQYKDHFADARIDGRMLHYLTIEDLVALKVTNILHHLSVKRAIQVLRLCDFNGNCLKRRPLPEEPNPTDSPGEVMLWTNHRVMEWLRSIDLSEYAPNLRGSGVHGGVMVLEPRYGAEVFASLLSIPSNKTLLRRHLSTHFIALIGSEIQQKKREIEIQPGFLPLTPSQKVKLKKRLFSHKRTRSTDAQEEDLVCPLGVTRQNVLVNNGQANGSPSWSREGSLPREEKQNMLAQDRFLDDVPTSDV